MQGAVSLQATPLELAQFSHQRSLFILWTQAQIWQLPYAILGCVRDWIPTYTELIWMNLRDWRNFQLVLDQWEKTSSLVI